MKEKNKIQKGFISIILTIVIAIAIISATVGIVKYKDEITANVSKVFESKIETSNVASTEENKVIKESELTKESIVEEGVEAGEKQDDTQRLQEQLRIAEQKRLEAEKQLAEEKAKQETERIRVEQEAQRLAEEQRRQEIEKEAEESLKKAQEDTTLKIAQCQANARVQTDAYLNKAYQMFDEAILPKIKELDEQIKQLKIAMYQAAQEMLPEELRVLDPDQQKAIREAELKTYEPSIKAAESAKQGLETKLELVKNEARRLFEQEYNKLYSECLKK